MQIAKRLVSSVCYGIGFGLGTIFITMNNALDAGFQAADRRFARMP